VSGPNPPDGVHLADVAAEMALGALTGRERARAIAHLEKCRTCRANVQRINLTATRLLVLLPEHQPPAGFADRVVRRLPYAGRHRERRRPRDRFPAVAATIIAATCALAGFALRPAPRPAREPVSSTALRSAPFTTARHQAIGTVFVHGGSQPWLFMAVDTGAGDRTVVCELQERDGHVITVGSFQLANGRGYWGSPEPDQAANITSVRLSAADGIVVATASFPAAR
jgi:hypothetical protein